MPRRKRIDPHRSWLSEKRVPSRMPSDTASGDRQGGVQTPSNPVLPSAYRTADAGFPSTEIIGRFLSNQNLKCSNISSIGRLFINEGDVLHLMFPGNSKEDVERKGMPGNKFCICITVPTPSDAGRVLLVNSVKKKPFPGDCNVPSASLGIRPGEISTVSLNRLHPLPLRYCVHPAYRCRKLPKIYKSAAATLLEAFGKMQIGYMPANDKDLIIEVLKRLA